MYCSLHNCPSIVPLDLFKFYIATRRDVSRLIIGATVLKISQSAASDTEWEARRKAAKAESAAKPGES